MRCPALSKDEIVQEMIRTAVQALPGKRRNKQVTKKQILKVLFRAKEMLPDENPVKDCLAFYWYLEGPFSEIIHSNIESLAARGVLRRGKTDRAETYVLAHERASTPLMGGDDYVVRAAGAVETTVGDFDDTHAALEATCASAHADGTPSTIWNSGRDSSRTAWRFWTDATADTRVMMLRRGLKTWCLNIHPCRSLWNTG